MYRGKHEVPRKGLGKFKNSYILLVSLLLIMSIGVGGAMAILMDSTNPVINLFKPAQVSCQVLETLQDNVKTNVRIKNTSNIDTWIRATYVVSWQDGDGNIYGKAPVAGTDYKITLGTGWISAGDYYYWPNRVAVNDVTGDLITRCDPITGKSPTGYHLSVEILAEAIQGDGMGAASAQDAWAKAKLN